MHLPVSWLHLHHIVLVLSTLALFDWSSNFVEAGCLVDNLCCEGRQTACYADKTQFQEPVADDRDFAESKVRESHIVVEHLIGPNGEEIVRRTISRLYAPILEPILEIEGSGTGSDKEIVKLPPTPILEAPQISATSVQVSPPPVKVTTAKTIQFTTQPFNFSESGALSQDIVNRYHVVNQKQMARFRGSRPRGGRFTRNVIFKTIPADTLLQVEHTPPIPLENRCFCDGVCGELGDCCDDFVPTCKPLNCILNEWSGWGQCRHMPTEIDDQTEGSGQMEATEHCGMGVQVRKRHVLQEPFMGGKRCDHHEEQRVCYSYCQQEVLREVALLLPYEFNAAREDESAAFLTLNKKLKRKIALKNEKSYCLSFKPVWTSHHCKSEVIASTILSGPSSNITIMCHKGAMNEVAKRCSGEGVQGIRSFWKLAVGDKYCFGAWYRIEKEKEDCDGSEADFIFV